MKFTPFNSGLLLGAVSVMMTIILYLMGPQTFAQGWISFALLIISIALIIYTGIQYRNTLNEGFLSYQKAYVFLLIVTVVSLPISSLSRVAIMSLDPQFSEQVVEKSLEATMEVMSKLGLPDDQVEQAAERARGDFEEANSLKGALMSLVYALPFMLIINLLLALAIRKNKPEFA
ncbi:MAG TPA: DUF4199 domain-containing protein [Luteibaculaceae bacterium]|nr:DUF4199 domain-containing protein [Luteibaculaceae bacterium]